MTDGHRGRILVLSPWPVLRELEGGGGTPVLTDLLEYLTGDGFDVELVLPSGASKLSAPPRGVRYHRVSEYPRATNPISGFFGFVTWNVRLAVYGYRLARQVDRPRAIYGLSALTIPAAAVCARLVSRPAVGVLFGTFLYPCIRRRRRLLASIPEVIAFRTPVSRLVVLNDGTQGDLVAEWLRVPKSRVRFWMYGLDAAVCDEAAARGDARATYGIRPGSPLVVSSSRLATWKRVDRVLNAFAIVVRQQPEAVLAVAGTGPEQQTLEELAERLGISSSVRFLGALPREENLQLVSSADVFVSLYDFSNVGVALLEALACGAPVVAADTGATRDFVQDEENGLIVPPDDEQATARAICSLLADPGLRNSLGAEARRRARERFLTRDERRRLELEMLDEIGARHDVPSLES
jgi:glycosyltransferase involved in cell wall biosynthesis